MWSVIIDIIVKLFTSIFSTNSPRKNTVEHATPEVPINDHKTDVDRLKDLGL
jgi:hypothetical protein